MSDYFLQVDLDALKVMGHVARGMKTTRAQVLEGLLGLWEWCYIEKTDRVSSAHLEGFFGAGDPAALVAFGFLEAVDAGTWRVRGAESRILKRQAKTDSGRSKGGHAAKSNLKQFKNSEPKKEPKPRKPPVERTPSEWQESWDTMQALAEKRCAEAEVAWEPEEQAPQKINATLKRLADRYELTADDIVAHWQRWLEEDYPLKKYDRPYPLGVFLSERVFPKVHEQWSENERLIAEFNANEAEAGS